MAYKGRVLDCLTAEGRKFFREEFREKDNQASLRKIEFLIIDVVRPYKIGLFVFLGTTLLLGLFFFLKSESAVAEQLAAIKIENAKLREELDTAMRRLATATTTRAPDENSASAGLDNMAAIDREQFFNQLIDLAEKQKITKDEVARLIRVGAARDPYYTLMRVRGKTALTSALNAAELAELVKNGTRK